MSKQANAKKLVDRIRGQDWINTVPPEFRSALLYVISTLPGVGNDVLEDDLINNIISSQVTTNRENEREKKTTILDTTVLLNLLFHNQIYDEELGITMPRDRYLTPRGAELGDPLKDIRGLNATYDLVETVPTSPTTLENYLLGPIPGVSDIKLPDVLQSISCVMSKNVGNGVSTGISYPSSSFLDFFGPGFSDLLEGIFLSGAKGSAEAEATSSASILPTLLIKIKRPYGFHKPTSGYYFYLRQDLVTRTNILNKLNNLGVTVADWPKFNPALEMFVAKGAKLSVRAHALAQRAEFGSAGAFAYYVTKNSGYNYDISGNVEEVQIPPTIHGAISIGGDPTSDTQSVTATAHAHVDGTALAEAVDVDAGVLPVSSIFGAVTPTSLIATPGDNVIPASGKRLLDCRIGRRKWGYVEVFTELFDFADL